RVVGDAQLDHGARGVAEEPDPGRAARAGQDLDPAAREADAGAVEAFDHRLLGGPAPGEALGAPPAVGELGLGVGLAQEALAGTPLREGDAVDPDRVDADLHAPNCPTGSSAPRVGRVHPGRLSCSESTVGAAPGLI